MEPVQFFNNVHIMHAAVTHLPIAFAVLGLPTVLVGALTGMKRPGIQWFAFFAYILLSASAYWAVLTGNTVRGALAAGVPKTAADTLELHAVLGELIWIPAAATAIFIVFSTVQAQWLRAIFILLVTLGALATTALVAAAGLYGHRLVFYDGLGVQATASEPKAAAPPPETAPQAEAPDQTEPEPALEPAAPDNVPASDDEESAVTRLLRKLPGAPGEPLLDRLRRAAGL